MLKFIVLLCLSLSIAHAKSVLVIGDSHAVGPFGWEFDRLVRQQGGISRVATYASCGSIAQWWVTGHKTPCGYWERSEAGVEVSQPTASTPIFGELLKKHQPDIVVVELSGNYQQRSDQFSKDDMRAMVEQIRESGAQCFWITTPHTRLYPERISRLVSLVHEAVSDYCEVFESHLVTQYPAAGGDGIHYWFPAGIPIAKAWADAAVEKIFKRSR
ncbi:MAG: hypothetical protein ACLGG0_09695 [Bacteriovoracia bacterium]